MRESQKILLTPDYVWEEYKTRKGYTYANMPAYVGLLIVALMILVFMLSVLFVTISVGYVLFFVALTVFTTASGVILTRVICKRTAATLNSKPTPEIVFEKDVCINKTSHYDSESAGVDSYTLYFEKAGKISNYHKYAGLSSAICVGDRYYTASFSFEGNHLEFYSAKSYRLRDLTEEELVEEDAKYSEEEHKMLTTLLHLETQPKLQIRSKNPSWSNDDRFRISTEGELCSLTPIKQLAVDRFGGDLVSAAEYIARYADETLKTQLIDSFDAVESFVFLSVCRELTKKCYR